MTVVGAYDLHLYCEFCAKMENFNTRYSPGFAQFIGESFLGCVKQAKAEGWWFNRNKTITFCPDCHKKGRHKKAVPNKVPSCIVVGCFNVGEHPQGDVFLCTECLEKEKKFFRR